MSSFSACRVTPLDPAQAPEEVAFVGRQVSRQWTEGGGGGGGGRGQAGRGERLTGGQLQEPGGVGWRAGRQLAITGRGRKFT